MGGDRLARALLFCSVLLILALHLCHPCSAAQDEDFLLRYWKARCDRNRDGQFSRSELRAMLLDIDDDALPTEPQLDFLMKVYDVNGDGLIDFGDFVERFGAHFPLASVPTLPSQVHLSITNDPSEMIVMWTTRFATPTSAVAFGTAPSSLSQLAYGTNWTYTAGGWEGQIHYVLLKGLKPNTHYFYRVGSDAANQWSESTFDFTTRQPLISGAAFHTTFIGFGDMGTLMPMGSIVCESLIRKQLTQHDEFVVHIGDISYASTGFEHELQFIWDLFMEQIQPLAAHMPYIATVGNHEKFYNFSSFDARFRMPPNGVGSYYFSFDYGGIHFVSICTEQYAHPYSKGSDQYLWLEKDLASVNRDVTPWVIVMGHRPMYSSDTSTDSGPLQDTLEPLLLKYDVDLFLAGHMHCYERSLPVNRNQPQLQGVSADRKTYVNPTAPVHLVLGMAGALINEKWVTPAPAWSVSRMQHYGWGRFEVSPSKLHFEFVRFNQADSVADELWIIRQ